MKLHSDLLKNLVESAPDAMLIVDGEGTVLYANEQVSALFGCSREEVVGESVDLLLPERHRAKHAHHRRGFAADRRLRPMGAGLDLLGRRSDGTEFPVEISLSPLREGLVAAAIRDVTDRKRVEHELIKAREQADLAKEEADRANIAKSRFLATASHDLRQPLQALSMLHGTLRRLEGDPQVRDAVLQQGHAIDAMKRLLNALLDISKLESGAVQPQACDVALEVLFEEIRCEFESIAAGKGIALIAADGNLAARSDPALLEQLLRNLVSNAIKYTRAGHVSLRAVQDDGCIRIEVSDTGIGIPEDQLPFIFDEFFQVGVARNTTREGYGLGLAIVQRIAKLLKLPIGVRSKVGEGTTFTIDLPQALIKDTSMSTAASGMTAARREETGQILLVEDEPSVLQATRLLLELEGYAVLSAANRAEALQVASENPQIRLLITDYHLLENETGLDVIAAMRATLDPRLPAILVTGDTSSALRRLRDDSRLRLASKPLDAEELLSSMNELLNATTLRIT